jgi:uncharacterized protein (DUF302 family)
MRDCFIIDECLLQLAKKVLDQGMSILTALPCRISVYPKGG